MEIQKWLFASWDSVGITAISVFIMYTIIVVLVRIFGLRSFAKMSSFDFASTVAIGSILASVILNASQSIVQGIVALAVILLYQQLFSGFKRRNNAFENAVENNPTYLMIGERIMDDNLTRCGVTESDLMAKLREANVLQLSEVKCVVFETTGDISVLHGEGSKQVDEMILGGVVK